MLVIKFIKRRTAIFAVVLIVTATLTSANASGKYVVPVGSTVGIEIETRGIIVSGIGQVETESGIEQPAFDAGIRPGDIITKINSTDILSAGDLQNVMRENSGEKLAIRISRRGEDHQFALCPAKNVNGGYELGLWLRDGISGIGTITYYEPGSGLYGALGHAITDVDTGVLMPVRSGAIRRSEVTGIVRGTAGVPGELVGSFETDDPLGSVDINTSGGIFGTLFETGCFEAGEAVEIAGRDEINTGKAHILSNICGDTVNEYEIEILKVYGGEETSGRGMMLRVTDNTLLEMTGGIVQGMSGSPIIQNGKLIGAVTHVLVNDPARGYGIAIDSMLNAAKVA